MCAHTDSLCVSDFRFYVYIHIPSQRAFRTDHIDPTRRYQLQSAGGTLTRDQQQGTRHSALSEAATTTAATPPTSPATHELVRRSAASSEAADRLIHAAKTAWDSNLRDGVKDSEIRNHRNRAGRHGVSKRHLPIYRAAKCRICHQTPPGHLDARLPSSR